MELEQLIDSRLGNQIRTIWRDKGAITWIRSCPRTFVTHARPLNPGPSLWPSRGVWSPAAVLPNLCKSLFAYFLSKKHIPKASKWPAYGSYARMCPCTLLRFPNICSNRTAEQTVFRLGLGVRQSCYQGCSIALEFSSDARVSVTFFINSSHHECAQRSSRNLLTFHSENEYPRLRDRITRLK